MSKILLVEDNPVASEMYVDRLSLEKFEVELAVSSEGALKKIIELKPDLILLDIMLPKNDFEKDTSEKNGFEVLKKIKSDPSLSQIKVIALTNALGKEQIEKGLSLGLGADDYILKLNFTPTEIVNKIKQVLGK